MLAGQARQRLAKNAEELERNARFPRRAYWQDSLPVGAINQWRKTKQNMKNHWKSLVIPSKPRKKPLKTRIACIVVCLPKEPGFKVPKTRVAQTLLSAKTLGHWAQCFHSFIYFLFGISFGKDHFSWQILFAKQLGHHFWDVEAPPTNATLAPGCSETRALSWAQVGRRGNLGGSTPR